MCLFGGFHNLAQKCITHITIKYYYCYISATILLDCFPSAVEVKTKTTMIPSLFTASSSYTYVNVLHTQPLAAKLPYCAFKCKLCCVSKCSL